MYLSKIKKVFEVKNRKGHDSDQQFDLVTHLITKVSFRLRPFSLVAGTKRSCDELSNMYFRNKRSTHHNLSDISTVKLMNEFVTNLSFKPDEDYTQQVFFDDLKRTASQNRCNTNFESFRLLQLSFARN